MINTRVEDSGQLWGLGTDMKIQASEYLENDKLENVLKKDL